MDGQGHRHAAASRDRHGLLAQLRGPGHVAGEGIEVQVLFDRACVAYDELAIDTLPRGPVGGHGCLIRGELERGGERARDSADWFPGHDGHGVRHLARDPQVERHVERQPVGMPRLPIFIHGDGKVVGAVREPQPVDGALAPDDEGPGRVQRQEPEPVVIGGGRAAAGDRLGPGIGSAIHIWSFGSWSAAVVNGSTRSAPPRTASRSLSRSSATGRSRPRGASRRRRPAHRSRGHSLTR